jgi:NAD(P)-dependent dehydrogenase (short-subunit alcohol dehydrogenase family)
LAAEGLAVRFERLDVADPTSVDSCATRLADAGTALDVLINNAGVYPVTPVLALDEDRFADALQVNLLGAWRTCRAFVPGMSERGYGRVVNVSSGDGAICDQAPGSGAYGITKTALNALTRVVAAETGPGVKVNAMCPGWVATDMGGASAPISPAEATDTLVWLATLPEDGPTNGFFRNREPVAW